MVVTQQRKLLYIAVYSRALHRLRDLHRDEFAGLLDKERERAGLPPRRPRRDPGSVYVSRGPLAVEYAAAVLAELRARADTATGLWSGSLGALTEQVAPKAAPTQVLRLLKADGHIELVRRGGRTGTSVWKVH